MLLLGCKSDAAGDATRIEQEEAQALAQRHGGVYLETSAVAGTNVSLAFTVLRMRVHRILRRMAEKKRKEREDAVDFGMGSSPGAGARAAGTQTPKSTGRPASQDDGRDRDNGRSNTKQDHLGGAHADDIRGDGSSDGDGTGLEDLSSIGQILRQSMPRDTRGSGQHGLGEGEGEKEGQPTGRTHRGSPMLGAQNPTSTQGKRAPSQGKES